MKAKVIIENGETNIILTPENEFEVDVIEKVYNKNQNYSQECSFNADYNYGSLKNHNIKIKIKETK